ncbi:hypothetical protein MRN59_05600 [Macrococcoides caseolyticum]|uniref:hypothetical protein n=1 Tax=Macrococcoides caseolyticum TaxID=69966 RepID=UPI00339D76C1
MDINTLKTKNNFHNYVSIKQIDNTSPIELLLCGNEGSQLTNLNTTCTVTLLDTVDNQIRQKSTEKIVGGLLTFKVKNALKANNHNLEVTLSDGSKYPSDGDFTILVSKSHTDRELEIINTMTYNDAVKKLAENIVTDFVEEKFYKMSSEDQNMAEVIEAREGSQSLIERIRKTEERMPIFLTSYGVSCDASPSQNVSNIKKAITEAKLTNRPIIFPWTPTGKYIDINEEITIDSSLVLQGFGLNTALRQTVDNLFVFDDRGKNSTIKGFAFYGTNGKTQGGIRATNDNIVIDDVYGKGLFWVVRVMSFDMALNQKRTLVKNVQVTNLTSDYCNFGLLVEGSEGLYYNNIRGTYALISGRMPHLIYFADGRGEMGLAPDEPIGENINPVGGDCMAWDSGASFPYQFKYTRNGNFTNLYARSCYGLLNLMEVSNTKLKNLSSTDDQNPSTNYGSIEIDGKVENIKLEDVYVNNNIGGKLLRMGNGVTNSTIKNIEGILNNNVEVPVGYALQVDGTNNKVINPIVKNLNESIPWMCSIGVFGGTGHTIERPETAGNTVGVFIKGAGSTIGGGHKIVNYSIEDLKISTLKPSAKALEIPNPSVELIPAIRQDMFSEKERIIAYERFDKISGTVPAITNTTSGHVWEVASGTWNVKNSRAYASAGSEATAYITLETKNYEISAGVKYNNREILLVRGTDKNNFLGLRLNHTNNTIEIVKRLASENYGISVVASASFKPQIGRRYKMKLQVFGNQLDGYVDDKLLISYTLNSTETTAFADNTKTGLFSGNNIAMFDNVEWRTLE